VLRSVGVSMRERAESLSSVRAGFCALVACALLAPSGPALAATPGSVEEFPVETIYRGDMGEIAPGPEGNIWLVQSSEYLSPRGVVERISMNGLVTGAFYLEPGLPGDIAEGPDGDMWFTEDASRDVEENGEVVEEPNMIARVSPAGTVTDFPIPNSGTKSYYSYTLGPLAIAADGKGNMWFTDQRPNKEGKIFIGRINSAGVITEFRTPTGSQSNLPESGLPVDIALGAEGNMWFTDQGVNNEGLNLIGQITPSGKITEFPIPTPGSLPTSIALGPDGNMWFTETGASKIGRITPSGGITEYPVPGISGALNGITLAPDGNMWFTGKSGTNPIGWITPAGAVRTLGDVPVNASPSSIATGGDGDIWFTDPRFSAPEMLSTSFVGRIVTPLVPANTGSPALSGYAIEGQLLSVTEGSWTHEPTEVSYQWQLCDAAGLNCENIAGAVGPTYLLQGSEVGHALRATVTASTLAGSSSAASNLSAAVVAASSPTPPSTAVSTPGRSRPPVVAATITWRFAWSSTGTLVKSLVVHGLPAGSLVEAGCGGRACAFGHWRLSKPVSRRSCKGRRCQIKGPTVVHGELGLAGLFKSKRLLPGPHVVVSVARPGWIGKRVVFVVQRDLAPSVQSSCLEPGSVSLADAC
jgi:streptogramin lyase